MIDISHNHGDFYELQGIKVSIGHQIPKEGDIERLVEAGCTLATHVGNGMPNMIHRHHNPIWTILAEVRHYLEIN